VLFINIIFIFANILISNLSFSPYILFYYPIDRQNGLFSLRGPPAYDTPIGLGASRGHPIKISSPGALPRRWLVGEVTPRGA
jgi:hypothetical protein